MNSIIIGWVVAILMFLIGAILIIANAGWLTFLGMFLFIWANNIDQSKN